MRNELRLVGALLLIVAGLFLLLDALNILAIGAWIWTAIFAIAGLAFLWNFAKDREQWWSLIPGFVLLGLAGLILVGSLFPELGEWAGALFFVGLALGFLAVYLQRREFWWAIIPAGAMLTLALITGLSTVWEGEAVGGVLFLGLGATFAALSLVQTPQGQLRWARIPAAILTIFGLILIVAFTAAYEVILPILLILGGLAFLGYFFLRRS